MNHSPPRANKYPNLKLKVTALTQVFLLILVFHRRMYIKRCKDADPGVLLNLVQTDQWLDFWSSETLTTSRSSLTLVSGSVFSPLQELRSNLGTSSDLE